MSKHDPCILKVFTLTCVSILLIFSGSASSSKEIEAASSKVKYNPSYKNLGHYKIYEGDLKSLSALNIRDAKLQLITNQLDKPWAFEFINKDNIIISEIGGRIKLLNLKDNSLVTIQNMPHILTNDHQIGLLDVEIHPNFKQNQKIYFSYSKHDSESENYFTLAVSVANIKGNQLENIQTIFDSNPFTWSPSNFGGALEFDDEGSLYIATGDRSESESAQNMQILQGKILRVNDDGTAAAGNPFEQVEAIDNRIYSTGVRNPQGLHFDALSKTMFESEHGPMGGDEINVIQSGANYGWPAITYGISYTGKLISQSTHNESMAQPIYYYLPSEAYSPLTVYRGTMFHEWQGDILVGALKGKHVSKIDYDDGVIRSEHPILTEINDRIRDIKVAHDGAIYILSQKGELNRLYREETTEPPVEDETDGVTIYKMACSGCHDNGAYNAPALGNSSQWEKTLQQPISLTYKHTIEGFNAMPAKGYCNICTEKHLKKAVDYMLEQAKQSQPD